MKKDYSKVRKRGFIDVFIINTNAVLTKGDSL